MACTSCDAADDTAVHLIVEYSPEPGQAGTTRYVALTKPLCRPCLVHLATRHDRLRRSKHAFVCAFGLGGASVLVAMWRAPQWLGVWLLLAAATLLVGTIVYVVRVQRSLASALGTGSGLIREMGQDPDTHAVLVEAYRHGVPKPGELPAARVVDRDRP